MTKSINHNNHTNVISDILRKKNVYKAYKKSLEGESKYTLEAINFAEDETYNIRELVWSIRNGTYVFDGYFNFTTYEPKERKIDTPIKHKDKIAQLMITQILDNIYNPSFIYDSYACKV